MLANIGSNKFLIRQGISIASRKDFLFSECRSRWRDKCCREGMRRETQATWIRLPVATNRRRSLWPHVKLVIGALKQTNKLEIRLFHHYIMIPDAEHVKAHLLNRFCTEIRLNLKWKRSRKQQNRVNKCYIGDVSRQCQRSKINSSLTRRNN